MILLFLMAGSAIGQSKLVIMLPNKSIRQVLLSGENVFAKDTNNIRYNGKMTFADSQHIVIKNDTIALGSIKQICKKGTKAGGNFLTTLGVLSIVGGTALLIDSKNNTSWVLSFIQELMGVTGIANGVLFEAIGVSLSRKGRINKNKRLVIIR